MGAGWGSWHFEALCYRPSGSWTLVSGLSLYYLNIVLCLTLKFAPLAFRFGKFKFRFPSSLRYGSILWNIKFHTTHLDIKEWEVWSVFISVSLWIFLFVVFSAYSPQTKEKRRTGSQPAKWPARLPTLCFLGGRSGGGGSGLSKTGKSSVNSERKQ